MMRKNILLLALLLTLTACGNHTNSTLRSSVGDADNTLQLAATNLMEDVDRNDIAPSAVDTLLESSADKTTEIVDFSFDIFKHIYEGENTLISPLSIISALSMTANGAQKETLSQIEDVFGTDINSLNEYLYAYKSYLPTTDKYKVSLANSIWFKDMESLMVEKEFLQTNKRYYDAEVYKAPFDESTKNDINTWVNKKTSELIKELLAEKPPEDAVMYLINALSFDAEWQRIYQEDSVREGEFTTQDGNKKTVDFMRSTEHAYIELPNTVGFSKPYADNKYSFVALLPDEELTVSDFIASIDGKTLLNAIKNPSKEKVHTSMPKFTFEYSKELAEVLEALGMKDAFDEDIADFSSLGQVNGGNIFINRVIHKTKIEVDEKGTKAGAVTAVEMVTTSATLEEPKTVNLDRPFLFMIVDNEFSLPIFTGVLNDVTE